MTGTPNRADATTEAIELGGEKRGTGNRCPKRRILFPSQTQHIARTQHLPLRIKQALLDKNVQLIQECGEHMQFSASTTYTAVIHFQRFCRLKRVLQYQPSRVAAACLFLATKVQGERKCLEEVIYWKVKLGTRGSKKHPNGMFRNRGTKEYEEERKAVLAIELDVLRTVAFELSIDSPYGYMQKIIDSHFASAQKSQVLQVAESFVSHSLTTNIPVIYSTLEIATAAMGFSVKHLGYNLPDGMTSVTTSKAWHQCLDVKSERVNEIYESMSACYEMVGTKEKLHTTERAEGASKVGSEHRKTPVHSKPLFRCLPFRSYGIPARKRPVFRSIPHPGRVERGSNAGKKETGPGVCDRHVSSDQPVACTKKRVRRSRFGELVAGSEEGEKEYNSSARRAMNSRKRSRFADLDESQRVQPNPLDGNQVRGNGRMTRVVQRGEILRHSVDPPEPNVTR